MEEHYLVGTILAEQVAGACTSQNQNYGKRQKQYQGKINTCVLKNTREPFGIKFQQLFKNAADRTQATQDIIAKVVKVSERTATLLILDS